MARARAGAPSPAAAVSAPAVRGKAAPKESVKSTPAKVSTARTRPDKEAPAAPVKRPPRAAAKAEAATDAKLDRLFDGAGPPGRDQRVISVRGAREHNLKNVDLTIPRDRLVVFTGLSGSGKSSLAFDTIYAEGQRRYVESLSAYARQFLEMMAKPDVDQIDGLSPAISIEQKTTSKNPARR